MPKPIEQQRLEQGARVIIAYVYDFHTSISSRSIALSVQL